jgi:hypothetical protein
MKKIMAFPLAFFAASLPLFAASTAAGQLSLKSSAINEVSLGAGSTAIVLDANSAVAGSDATSATATTTFGLTTNSATAKSLQVSISPSLNANTTLSIDAAGFSGTGVIKDAGTTVTKSVVTLSSTVSNGQLLNGLAKIVIPTTATLTYTYFASVVAGVVATQAITITYTLT